ncbi:hypothetical protein F0562_016751 [Nyssa sinensis]|uniref:PHD-type domain-containing protein n=1 Tax=Nyssa sinensis TaxID=561372 RepID=A0A5J4ZG60_9ASTE|nr:hypothetical protein F0562_016751 [Nyssa sinensis]
MGEEEDYVAVLNDEEMENKNSPRVESKRDNQWLAGNTETEPCTKKQAREASNETDTEPCSRNQTKEASNDAEKDPCTKNQVKEASNEDICSEVSNPNLSPKDNASSVQTINSQPAEIVSNNQVGCGEITSTCSGNSSTEESLSGEEHSTDDTSGAVSTSNVILEIPKHASSTGVSTRNPCGSLQHQMTCYPTNVKKLLSTGILEGARVKYVYSSKEKELSGIVSGGGYLCGCSTCNFSKILSAYEFELHAGGKTRHPNNHIYLENGKPIYSIIQELKTAPLSVLDEVIKDVAGSSVNEEYFQIWKASLQQNNEIVKASKKHHIELPGMYHSTTSFPGLQIEDSLSPTSCSHTQSFSFKLEACMKETAEKRKRVAKKPSSYFSSSVVLQKKTSEGGTKKRDNDLHRLLFMPNGLPDGTDLAYYSKGQRILGGYKQGNGIVCSCCDTEISPSQFEAHAGWSARRQPYRNIYISSGLTLHDIALSLANGQNLATGHSDDMCAVCGDGGELIICDGCPRAFHAACLELQCAPKESEIGGCVVCRAHDFSVAKFDERTVLLCDQCEKEYHVGCLRVSGLCDLKELPKDKWFCCTDCSRIHVALQNLVSNGVEMIPASVLNTINRKHVEKGLTDGATNDVQWRILSGKSRYPEHLPLLSTAAAIFRECFDPIVARSGRDLIPVMVYGRNISGQEFGGMYCVVLIVKSVVVSAGLLRIFGREVAELPLVATIRENQGKGYFQALFSCIERLLLSLNVEKLVLPAAEEAESIWTKKLGFIKMSDERLLKYTRDFQLTIFKGTSMLEKELQQIID